MPILLPNSVSARCLNLTGVKARFIYESLLGSKLCVIGSLASDSADELEDKLEACRTLTDVARAALPIPVSQLLLQDLAGSTLGQLAVEEFNRSGQLVVGQSHSAEFHKLARGGRLAVKQGDACMDRL